MIPVAIGVALASGFVAWMGRRAPEGELRAYAVGLVVAAAIYVGFAVRGLGEPVWLVVEGGGVVLFALVSRVALTRSSGRRVAGWLAAGWLVHVAWDLALHGDGGPAFVPDWYPLLCAGFDPVVAAGALRSVRRGTRRDGDTPSRRAS